MSGTLLRCGIEVFACAMSWYSHGACYTMSGTDLAQATLCLRLVRGLRAGYGKSGTELAYGRLGKEKTDAVGSLAALLTDFAGECSTAIAYARGRAVLA
eukprot:2150590-Rhodomonas_salina.5